jgi:hypothetical protein
MSNKKQTAVEWLVGEINKYIAWNLEGDNNAVKYTDAHLVRAMEQAKELEKEQIINAYVEGSISLTSKSESEQYYKETYTDKP